MIFKNLLCIGRLDISNIIYVHIILFKLIIFRLFNIKSAVILCLLIVFMKVVILVSQNTHTNKHSYIRPISTSFLSDHLLVFTTHTHYSGQILKNCARRLSMREDKSLVSNKRKKDK